MTSISRSAPRQENNNADGPLEVEDVGRGTMRRFEREKEGGRGEIRPYLWWRVLITQRRRWLYHCRQHGAILWLNVHFEGKQRKRLNGGCGKEGRREKEAEERSTRRME